jgi:glycosyltransferase involved in cell wall biosynthesis
LDGWPAISVVLPVLNEKAHLRAAVTSILEQDYPGDLEVIVALGPSHDGTAAVAAAVAAVDARIRLVDNPSGRTPEGLNRAIAESHHGVIARVDGHAELPPHYLRLAVETLQRTGADNVGGLMWAEGQSDYQLAVARAMTSKLGVGNAPFHVGGEEGPVDSVYLGVFRRDALDRVQGYDETFSRAQDWELNYRIRRSGGTVWFDPRLRVAYRPRGNPRALATQYYHYGHWRRQVMRRHPGSVSLRYLAPPAAVLGIVGGAGLAARGRRIGLLAPLGYAAFTLVAAGLTGKGLTRRQQLIMPGVYATMQLSWGTGFLSASLPRRRWIKQRRRKARDG